MSKGLEALERITEHLDLEDEYFYKQEKFDEETIEKELKDYENLQKVLDDFGIYNTMNLIDTLKNIQILEKQIANLEDLCERHYDEIERDSKKLKALEIIKEKGIILQFIKETYTVEQYNAGVFGTLVKPLIQEEYELLKDELLWTL